MTGTDRWRIARVRNLRAPDAPFAQVGAQRNSAPGDDRARARLVHRHGGMSYRTELVALQARFREVRPLLPPARRALLAVGVAGAAVTTFVTMFVCALLAPALLLYVVAAPIDRALGAAAPWILLTLYGAVAGVGGIAARRAGYRVWCAAVRRALHDVDRSLVPPAGAVGRGCPAACSATMRA